MKFIQLHVDQNLREYFEYPDEAFPLEIWTDRYEELEDRTLPCHWHDSFEAGVVLKGEVLYSIDGAACRLRAGDGVFVNANALHTAAQAGGENALMSVVTFRPSLFGTDGTVARKYIAPVLASPVGGFRLDLDTEGGRGAAEALMRMSELDRSRYGYELACLSLVSRMLLYVTDSMAGMTPPARVGRRGSERMKKLLSAVYAHYGEPIGTDGLAAYAHISRSECFRCFRRYAGKTPGAYLEEYRLAQAAMMLRETDRTVTETGTACGFAAPGYFGKRFKEKYGLTPRQYRAARTMRK